MTNYKWIGRWVWKYFPLVDNRPLIIVMDQLINRISLSPIWYLFPICLVRGSLYIHLNSQVVLYYLQSTMFSLSNIGLIKDKFSLLTVVVQLYCISAALTSSGTKVEYQQDCTDTDKPWGITWPHTITLDLFKIGVSFFFGW